MRNVNTRITFDAEGGLLVRNYASAFVLISLLVCLVFSPVKANADWIVDGTRICSSNSFQWSPSICPDGDGGFYVVWGNYGGMGQAIKVQRMDDTGNRYWDPAGVTIFSTDGGMPLLVPDGSGGAIVAWTDYSGSDDNIKAQRIDSTGNPLWTIDGVFVCSSALDQKIVGTVTDGAGGAIIVWSHNDGFFDLYAQRIDGSGTPQWTAGGVALCTAAYDQISARCVADGSGGIIVAWHDERARIPGTIKSDIYAQRISSAGVPQWTADGVGVCTIEGNQFAPDLIPAGAGGAIITWDDNRAVGNPDIYAQYIDAGGAPQWTADGVPIAAKSGSQTNPRIAQDGLGGAFIAWMDGAAGTDIYAQRIHASGTAQWPAAGIPVCTAVNFQSNIHMIFDGIDAVLLTWADERSDWPDLYAQKVALTGAVQWTVDGVSVSSAAYRQMAPSTRPQHLISDGAGGAFLVWTDDRNNPYGEELVYAQRFGDGIAPVATQLKSFRATAVPNGIEICWSISEAGPDCSFTVHRRNAGSREYCELAGPVNAVAELSYSFKDQTCAAGGTYVYRVEATDKDGTSILFETEPVSAPVSALVLNQNYPNPFYPATTISFTLPAASHVTLSVFTVDGKRIACLADRVFDSGTSEIIWNGIDDTGNAVSGGIYYYRLRSSKTVITRKMVLLR